MPYNPTAFLRRMDLAGRWPLQTAKNNNNNNKEQQQTNNYKTATNKKTRKNAFPEIKYCWIALVETFSAWKLKPDSLLLQVKWMKHPQD